MRLGDAGAHPLARAERRAARELSHRALAVAQARLFAERPWSGEQVRQAMAEAFAAWREGRIVRRLPAALSLALFHRFGRRFARAYVRRQLSEAHGG